MKQVGIYHVFPFQEVEKDSSIVIWGMGEVGQHYLQQVIQTGYCNVEFAVDKNWSGCKNALVKVMPPIHVKRAPEHAKIVIANGNGAAAGEIRKQLTDWGIPEERILWCDMIVDESIVVSDQITSQGKNVKRTGFYHIFPFQSVEKGETILLWSMGEVGRNYAKQLQKTGFCQVEYAVDSKWSTVKNAPVPVKPPQAITKEREKRIVIANGSPSAADAIKKQLAEMGVEESRILWDDMIIQAELVTREAVKPQAAGMPYLYGSESVMSRKMNPVRLTIPWLCDCDVVTFSIFDTLVFQCFRNREVFFALVGEKLGCTNFVQIRIDAEREAKLALEKNLMLDAPLDDIYKIIQKRTGIDSQKGSEIEVETEIEWCVQNPYLYTACRRVMLHEGKKVIFIEDTCFSRKHMYRILTHCGYQVNPEDIYVSCECYESKRLDGGLFRLVQNTIGKKLRYGCVEPWQKVGTIPAKKQGYNAYQFPPPFALGDKFRPKEMSDLVGEAYRQLVNMELHQGMEQAYSTGYEYGFIYGGILALGFTIWLNRRASRDGVEKVIFLSSDGTIFKDVYKLLFPSMNGIYVYWSEMVGLRLMARQNRHRIVEKLLYKAQRLEQAITVQDFFNELGLENLLQSGYHTSFLKQQEITPRVASIVGEFLQDYWEDVVDKFTKDEDLARKYISYTIGNARKIAIIDVSSYGENAKMLAQIMSRRWGIHPNIEIYTIGSNQMPVINSDTDHNSECINSYCFNRSYQRNLHDFHFNSGNSVTNYFSLLWSHPEPELKGFTLKNDRIGFTFEAPVVENYQIAKEIQNGIVNFCKKYLKFYSKSDFLMDISGWDAYIPFQHIASYPDYYKNISSRVVY